MTNTGAIARDWVTRLASGKVSAEDLARFRTWLAADPAHREAFERERLTWQRLATLERDFATRAAARPRRRLILAAGLGMAGCLALLLAWPSLRATLMTDHATGPGERASVTLPDGSIVHLNTDSAIAVRYSAGERRIELLRGEALFAVRGDRARPFRVAARHGISEAVGTAFAVRDRGDLVVTTITEGTVTVASPEAAPPETAVRAEAGDQVTYREGEAARRRGRVDIGAITAWQQGRIVLEAASFADALAELERYRRGRILLVGRDPASLRPVSGIFAIERIDEAVAGLAATHGLTASRFGDFLTVLH